MDLIAIVIWAGIGGLGTWGVLSIALSDLQSRRKNKACQSWPGTTGQVTSAEVVRLSHRVSEPKITYSYAVDGKDFTSSVVAYGLSAEYCGKKTMHEFVAGYPKGQKIEVFYNPADPSQSVLFQLKPRGFWSGFVAWFILLPAVSLVTFAAIWQGILLFRK